MLLRSESDFIWVTNAAHDLAGLVTAYLKLFRTHTQGDGGVNIPDERFAVTFGPSTREGSITVMLWWTYYYSTEVTQYYDVDDDMFSEAWGSDNSCGVSIEHNESKERLKLNIPIKFLMMSEAQMKSYFVDRTRKLKVDAAESARVKRIDELKKELSKLENKSDL